MKKTAMDLISEKYVGANAHDLQVLDACELDADIIELNETIDQCYADLDDLNDKLEITIERRLEQLEVDILKVDKLSEIEIIENIDDVKDLLIADILEAIKILQDKL